MMARAVILRQVHPGPYFATSLTSVALLPPLSLLPIHFSDKLAQENLRKLIRFHA